MGADDRGSMIAEGGQIREQELIETAEKLAAAPAPSANAGKAALVVDLSGVPETADPVFLRTLLRFIEKHTADIKHDSYLLGGYRFAVMASLEDAKKFLSVITELSGHLRKHNHGSVQGRIFDLGRQTAQFLTHCRELMAHRQQPLPPEPAEKLDGNLGDIESLISIERALGTADVSSLLREQGIWRIDPEEGATLLRTEVGTYIPALEQLLRMKLHTNPWLFQHATEILDHRTLRYLLHNQQQLRRGHSLNMHSSTIATRDFDEMANMIGPTSRHEIMIELPFLEYEADPAQFARTLERLKGNGFSVALDNMPWQRLAEFKMPPDVDWVKLAAGKEFGQFDEAQLKAVSEAIARIGVEHCVLTHCEDPAQISNSLRMGFRILQGYGIEPLGRDAENLNNVLVLAGLREEAAEEETAAEGEEGNT